MIQSPSNYHPITIQLPLHIFSLMAPSKEARGHLVYHRLHRTPPLPEGAQTVPPVKSVGSPEQPPSPSPPDFPPAAAALTAPCSPSPQCPPPSSASSPSSPRRWYRTPPPRPRRPPPRCLPPPPKLDSAPHSCPLHPARPPAPGDDGSPEAVTHAPAASLPRSPPPSSPFLPRDSAREDGGAVPPRPSTGGTAPSVSLKKAIDIRVATREKKPAARQGSK